MIPKYLFHYTSIETAKKIFQTNKIRFNRLDLLNDPYEGDFNFSEISASQNEKRKLVYCSCWNSEERESINLWHIYTDMRGIRLKMKSSMFSTQMMLEEQASGFVPVGEITHIPFACEMLDEAKISRVYGPFKVSYVSRFEDTYKTAISKSIANAGTDNEFEMFDINLRELGIKKINHWEYEGEWRYKISPCKEIHGSKKVMSADLEIKTPEYIDIPFIEKIEEILLAPQVSEEEYKNLMEFIRANKFDVDVKRSAIRYQSKHN